MEGKKINDLIFIFIDKIIFFKCLSVYNFIKVGIWMNVYIVILYLIIIGKVFFGYFIFVFDSV